MGCSQCGATDVAVITDGLKVVLAGNPNCGKTALFNALTGVRQKTGNWPGVTVDRKEGVFDLAGSRVGVVDLPGIYSLDSSSVDEEIARDYLLFGDADLVVNVVDASNLERNLYLTIQFLEMGLPVVLALNMSDVAESAGLHIDRYQLADRLGCPVVALVATESRGLDQLYDALTEASNSCGKHPFLVEYPAPIEAAIGELTPLVAEGEADPRWVAVKLLEGDSAAAGLVDPEATERVVDLVGEIASAFSDDVDIMIASARFARANTVANATVTRGTPKGRLRTDQIDQLVLSKRWGVPIFLLVMYAMFMFTINIGGAFIDFFDGIAGAIFVDGFRSVLTSIGSPEWLTVLLADGAGGGIQTVATFIPIVGALYLFLSAIEDSGYMARAAFLMERAMRSIGLPGRAFVPMIVGFGCNVPAVMATRTLSDQRERKLTILMNPFMSCGARLPVYALFAAAFFPTNGQNIVFALYAIGILAAIATGKIMKRTILSGESEGFMMELPVYHRPTLKGIGLHTWDRVKVFVSEAGRVIILMVLALSFLNSIGSDGSFGHADSDSSALSVISRTATPLLGPMGVDEDNWPATVGIVSGVLAKEVVVGSLDSLYANLASDDAEAPTDEPEFRFWGAIGDSFRTIPSNLAAVADTVLDPLGLGFGDSGSVTEQQGVHQGTLGAMATRFDGRIGAFAYLLFVLLYFPCVATLGAIVREAGRAWAAFVAFWTTSLAYYVSVTFYQAATFGRHPLSSALWIGSLTAIGFLIVGQLRRWANAGRTG